MEKYDCIHHICILSRVLRTNQSQFSLSFSVIAKKIISPSHPHLSLSLSPSPPIFHSYKECKISASPLCCRIFKDKIHSHYDMGHQARYPDSVEASTSDPMWPFGSLDGLDRDDLRMAAYEIFFTACRSSPGFGGRSALQYFPLDGVGDSGGVMPGSPVKGPGVGMAVTSRIKRALGLKMLRRSQSRRTNSSGSSPNSPRDSSSGGSPKSMGSPKYIGSPKSISFTVPGPNVRQRRPLTSAEIMRQQMRVTEQSDTRLRKTLMRTLVGQVC